MYNALFGRKEISVGKCKLEVNCGNKFDYGENTMKKLLALLFCFMIAKNVFAVELWNGFTSGMSENEVKQKCKTTLKSDNCWKAGSLKSKKLEIYLGDLHNKNNNFMEADFILLCRSPLEQFYRSRFGGFIEPIEFHFYENKLYAIRIPWALPGNDIIPQARKSLGEEFTYEECKITYGEITNKGFWIPTSSNPCHHYSWNYDEKTTYIVYETNSSNSEEICYQTVIFKPTIAKYHIDQQKLFEKQQAETEARQQRIRDNTVF